MQTQENVVKEQGVWKRGIVVLLCLAPFFFLTYGSANHYAASLSDVPSLAFAWEKHIPLWPWTIVPYWSIDLFYGLSLLLCWSRFELRQQALRLFSAQVIAVTCFVLWPLKFSFERPQLDGFFGVWFDVLMGFDKPFNQAPSLHIVLLLILWDFYRRHAPQRWAWLVHLWCFLIGLSVLTTWQHHFIDIPTGLLAGAFCMWLFPWRGKSPFQKDGASTRTGKHVRQAFLYLMAAAVCGAIGFAYGGAWLWLLSPTVSLLLVALAYLTVRPHFFQKQSDGEMTVASWLLYAPYFAGAWINSRCWTCAHPEDSLVYECNGVKLHLGRIPSASHAARYDALFDCAAELPVARHKAYGQALSLDLIPLNAVQLEAAVERLESLLQSSQAHSVLVFCALGYSRSAALLCAWLMKSGAADSADAAVKIIQQARPWVVLKPEQLDQLQLLQIARKERTS